MRVFLAFQSLWHIRRFRKDFLRRSALGHVHIGDPCVICALYDIFNALNTASSNLRSEAVAPTSLRTALSNLYPESNFFQEVTIPNHYANSQSGFKANDLQSFLFFLMRVFE